MKVLITAGGGGHFNPALAVIKKLPKSTEVLFVGRKYAFEGEKTLAFEYRTVNELGIPFKTITTGRLQRRGGIKTLKSLVKVPYGLLQAIEIVRSFRPDVVFSTGGYITLPVTIAAMMLRVPIIIHEQTRGAGLANKLAARYADKICLSFKSSEKLFPAGKTVLTGNTLKDEFIHPKRKDPLFANNKPLIVVTGGSLGSHAINKAVEGALPHLLKKYNIYHQTGDAKEYDDFIRLEAVRSALPDSLKDRYLITKFISESDIASVFREASLVVARSGINTITELIFLEKPALLIPLPYGQKNEQLENALYMESLGLARVKNQDAVNSETLYTEIEEIMDQLSTFRLKAGIPNPIQSDATEKIISVILSVTKKLPSSTEEAA